MQTIPEFQCTDGNSNQSHIIIIVLSKQNAILHCALG
jgi:hypothetical protein